ncbi:hypothetical protein [uncultured Rikenella sp.]|uniref:hypothetical protein n=1 Tax=uncultured Rikenella sp. TaxID=368003 RepID=UPI0025D7C8E9|nr:hypothetical protein [uncultured Rikenella sp.]
MKKKAIGLTEEGIQIAVLPEDGTAPEAEAYAALGKTYKDTATLETEEGETVSCECEELDDPEDEVQIPGKTTLKFSTSDLDPTSCHRALGGTLSEDGSEWAAPDSFTAKEVAVRFTTKSGLSVQIGRAKMSTRINWAIKKDGYGLLEHTLTVLTPKVAGMRKMTVTDTSVVPTVPNPEPEPDAETEQSFDNEDQY